jgi:hypothetical protein
LNDIPGLTGRRWQHVGMNPVSMFFLVGGALFLLVALFLRELNNEAAQIVALTFGLIGFFWMVPQLIIWVVRNRRSS